MMQIFQLFMTRRRRFARIVAFLSLVAMTLVIAVTSGRAQSGEEGSDRDAPSKIGATTLTLTGLRIADITVGSGPSPKVGQTCVINYASWLYVRGAKGDKVASPADSRQPVQFVLGKGQVRAEWEEGVATMKIGGKRTIIVPAQVGLGEFPTSEEGRERSSRTQLPGLVFEIELVDCR